MQRLIACWLLALLSVIFACPAFARQRDNANQQTHAYRKAAKKAQKDMRKYQKQQQKAMKKSAKAQRKSIKKAQRRSMR
jgi:hypothetical protein